MPFELDDSYAPTTPEPQQATPPAGGWIKLYRKALNDGWLRDHKLFVFFVYCLLRANHKAGKVFIAGQPIELATGQFITGRDQVLRDTGLTEQNYRTAIKRLKSTGSITTKTTNRFTIITVVNWNTYQARPDEFNDQCNEQSNAQPTSSQRAANDKQETKERKKEKTPPKKGGGDADKFLSYFSYAWTQYAPDRPFITNKDHHQTVVQMLAELSKDEDQPLNYLILQATQFFLDLITGADEPAESIKVPLLFFKSRQPAQAPMYLESVNTAIKSGLWPEKDQDFWEWLQKVSSQ